MIDAKAESLEEIFDDQNGMPTLSSLCKDRNKWGMYIHLPSLDLSKEELTKAAPYLRYPENDVIFVNRFGYFFFDHEDDMKYAFDVTIGFNGPNVWNEYDGPAKVYAVTCNPDGVQIDENC